jgi:ribulose 1,5-bisphosphate synthetase/thiazole synthase
MSIVEPERRTQVIGKYDIIVAGGGPSGTGAAIAAARSGANTLLLERYGFLGGMYTAGFVVGIHVDKTIPMKEYEEDRPLLGGTVQEMMDKLMSLKGVIPSEITLKYTGSNYTPSDPEMMKIALMEMVEDAGAKQLLHSVAVDAIVEDNKVKGVIIESKSGRQAILADVVIDCTGDGDVAVAAGCEWKKAPAKKLLSMPLHVQIGGIDYKKAGEVTPEKQKELRKKAEKEGFRAFIDTPEASKPRFPVPLGGKRPMIPPEVLKKYWQRGYEGNIRFSYNMEEGDLVGGDCSDVMDLTAAELYTRRMVYKALTFAQKNVPGYENAYLVATAPQIGVRESRRIMGEYVLTLKEDIEKLRKHNDVICQARRNPGTRYEDALPAFDIPYRCLVPRKINGILTAGRCISIDHDAAWIIAIRDEQQAMAIGEASGAAAALAVKSRVEPRDIDVQTLQETLRKHGVNI